MSDKNSSSKKVDEQMLYSELKKSNISGNITIKSFTINKELTQLEKQKEKLEKQLNQLYQKREEIRMLRDDQNKNTKLQFEKSSEAKNNRNEMGDKLNELRNEKNEVKKLKNELLDKKTNLYNELNKVIDKIEKNLKWEDLQRIKKQLPELFSKLTILHDEIVLTSDERQDQHENMIAFQMMGRQSKNRADKLHKEFIGHHKQIKSCNDELWIIRKKIREVDGH